MAFINAKGLAIQDNHPMLDYNDSRDYEHQSHLTLKLAVDEQYVVPVTNINAGEVLVVIKSNQRLSIRLQDTGSGMDGTVRCNRFFMATLQGLTGLTLTNLGAQPAEVVVVVADE